MEEFNGLLFDTENITEDEKKKIVNKFKETEKIFSDIRKEILNEDIPYLNSVVLKLIENLIGMTSRLEYQINNDILKICKPIIKGGN